MQMIFKGPDNEAKRIEQKTSVKTVAAKDGMNIKIADEIKIETIRKKQFSLTESTDDVHRQDFDQ
jgi:hypothetical protein